MTKNELFEKNVTLSMEFSRYVIENPEFAEKIPKGAQVVLLPQYDPGFCRENLKLAELHREKGQPVVYVKVEKLAPKRKSRLINPKLEVVNY